MITYEGRAGEHIETSAENSIALAERHNCKVKMKFNDVRITVNKRLSVRHVVRTFHHMIDATILRYSNSPKCKADKAKRVAELAEAQKQLEALMDYPPATKEDAASWLAKWIPLSDDIGVERYAYRVSEMLVGLGFFPDAHVGDKEFRDKTASKMKRLEWLVGQVISMLRIRGFVHPALEKFAEELS